MITPATARAEATERLLNGHAPEPTPVVGDAEPVCFVGTGGCASELTVVVALPGCVGAGLIPGSVGFGARFGSAVGCGPVNVVYARR